MRNLDISSALTKLLSLLVVVLMPIRSALLAVLVLIIADLCTGIWAALKEKRKITSHGLRRTVVKVLSYESAIIVSFIVETYLLEGVPLVKIITGFIGITEAKSFFENLKRITGIDFWSQIISKINMQDIKNTNPKE
jgi:phage-related holin